MNAKKYFILTALILTSVIAPIRSAYAQAASVSQQSKETYQKEMEMYEAARQRNQIVTYACLVILAVFIPVFLVTVKRGRANSQKMIQILSANQKVLEEIRDLLKAGKS